MIIPEAKTAGRTALQAGLMFLVLLVPLADGAVPDWAQSQIALAVFLLLLCVSFYSGIYRQPLWTRQMRLPLSLLVLWTAWIAFQRYPLPIEVVSLLSPARALQVQDLAQMKSWQLLIPPRMVLNADMDMHARRLLLTLTYVAAFIFAAWACRVRTGRWALLSALVASGIFQSVWGGYEVLTGQPLDLFGKTEHYRGYATGTYVNRNHFSGYLQFSMAAVLGLLLVYKRHPPFSMGTALTQLDRARRWLRVLDTPLPLLWLATGIMILGLLLSQSRMGNLAAAASLVCGLLIYLKRRHQLHRRALVLALIGLSVFMLVFYQVGHWQDLASRYQDTRLEQEGRWHMWPELLNLAKLYTVTGAGLGSFATIFPEYRKNSDGLFYDHAHNDYLQFWIETGAPGCLLLAGIVVLTARRAWRGLAHDGRSNRAIHMTALISLLAVAIHSTVDFNLQIPANALTLMLIIGACWGVPSRSGRKPDQ